MKTNQIKGAVDILLVTGLPEHPHRPKDMVLTAYLGTDYIDWQYHCRLSEMTEEQMAVITGRRFEKYKVQKQLNQQPQYNMFWVKYPDGTDRHFDTKDECYKHAIFMEFKSLLEANGVLKENPYKQEEIKNGSDFTFEQWQEAEANVFPPETTLIFIKIS